MSIAQYWAYFPDGTPAEVAAAVRGTADGLAVGAYGRPNNFAGMGLVNPPAIDLRWSNGLARRLQLIHEQRVLDTRTGLGLSAVRKGKIPGGFSVRCCPNDTEAGGVYRVTVLDAESPGWVDLTDGTTKLPGADAAVVVDHAGQTATAQVLIPAKENPLAQLFVHASMNAHVVIDQLATFGDDGFVTTPSYTSFDSNCQGMGCGKLAAGVASEVPVARAGDTRVQNAGTTGGGVLMNVRVTDAEAAGSLSIYPVDQTGSLQPDAYFGAGGSATATVFVRLPPNATTVRMRSTTAAHVKVTVLSWIQDDSHRFAGTPLVNVRRTRVLDSRPSGRRLAAGLSHIPIVGPATKANLPTSAAFVWTRLTVASTGSAGTVTTAGTLTPPPYVQLSVEASGRAGSVNTLAAITSGALDVRATMSGHRAVDVAAYLAASDPQLDPASGTFATTVDGQPMNGNVGDVVSSADGSVVVFSSSATNLVANDTNGQTDLFRWSRSTNLIDRLQEGPVEWDPETLHLNDNGTVLLGKTAVAHDPTDLDNSWTPYLFDLRTGAFSRVTPPTDIGIDFRHGVSSNLDRFAYFGDGVTVFTSDGSVIGHMPRTVGGVEFYEGFILTGDGSHVLMKGNDGRFYMWDLTAATFRRLPATFFRVIDASRDGKLVVAVSGVVRETYAVRRTSDGAAVSLGCTPNDRTRISADGKRLFRAGAVCEQGKPERRVVLRWDGSIPHGVVTFDARLTSFTWFDRQVLPATEAAVLFSKQII